MLESPWIDISGKDLPMTIIALVFALMWLIQIIWYWGIFSRIAFYRSPEYRESTVPVSVIIAAKNEYHNLCRNLELILTQDYPDYEVVVVNDASDDETEDYLKGLVLQYKHLNVLTIRSDLNYFRGKKFPLAIGIKAAKYETLLLTDADCRPSSPEWIYEMQRRFTDKTDFVLGYGGYETKRGLLNALVRWDTVHIAMQYLSLALCRRPYMGVGRNLAYKKSLFLEKGGFSSHYHVSGGDDDIFVNRFAQGSKTGICIDPKARTVSFAPPDFSFWVRQKRRHLSTGKFYKGADLLILSNWSVSRFLFLTLGIFLLLVPYNIIPVLALIVLRYMSQLIIFKKSMQQFSEKKLLLFSPIFELYFILYNSILAFSNLIKKGHQWK